MTNNYMPPNSTCKLCQRSEQLQNSHIIPEFFYKPMYDHKHRGLIVSTEPSEKIKHFQKGLREFLFCEKCETKFSLYEQYASQQLFYTGRTKYQDDKILIADDVDYARFKLFELSILWRASVSNLPFFEGVQLGPHEEIIRKMLLSDNPGEEYEYGCLMTAIFIEPHKVVEDLIVQPARIRDNGYRFYRFLFGGILWVFVVSSHNSESRLKHFFLKNDGSLTIFKKPIEEIKFLVDWGLELKQLGKI